MRSAMSLESVRYRNRIFKEKRSFKFNFTWMWRKSEEL